MDALFFWLSKLAWGLVSPDSLILLSLAAAWLLLRLGKTRLARRLLGAVVAALLILALLPVGEWVIYPLEKRFAGSPSLPATVDGIVLLGGAEQVQRSNAWDSVELRESGERYFAFVSLAKAYPDAKLVFAGGSGSLVQQGLKEADVAQRLLRQQGVDISRLLFENRSRNTAENARSAMSLVKPSPGESWVLVTSAFHMPRALGAFCNVGWAVIPYPVDHYSQPGRLLRLDFDLAEHLAQLRRGIREWMGLAAYYVLARTDALLPGPCIAH